MRPFSTDTDTLVSMNNREFIVAALQGDEDSGPFRIDGRAPGEVRGGGDTFENQIEISFGPLDGVCVVRLGHTLACATTTGQLERPASAGASAEGSLRVDVEFSSGACTGFARDGRASRETRQRSRDLGMLLERGLKDGRAVDVESLCVLAGKRTWAITCSVTILAHDGNLAGVASLAACGSLMTYRRPECSVDPNSGIVTVHSVDAREAIALNMHHFPIASTYCFFDEAPGLAVADPTLEEEITADGSVVCVVNSLEEVCAVSTSGNGVSGEDVKQCVSASVNTAMKWTEVLKAAAADFEAARLANKVRTHYDGYKDAPDDDHLLDLFYKPGRDDIEFVDDDAEETPQSDSAEDEDSDDDERGEDIDNEAAIDDDAVVTERVSTKKTKKKTSEPPKDESDEETRFREDDDIDALFDKAEKKKKKKLASWDDLPGDGESLADAVKPRKKLKKTSTKSGKK